MRAEYKLKYPIFVEAAICHYIENQDRIINKPSIAQSVTGHTLNVDQRNHKISLLIDFSFSNTKEHPAYSTRIQQCIVDPNKLDKVLVFDDKIRLEAFSSKDKPWEITDNITVDYQYIGSIGQESIPDITLIIYTNVIYWDIENINEGNRYHDAEWYEWNSLNDKLIKLPIGAHIVKLVKPYVDQQY